MTNVILLVKDNEDHAELIKQILENDSKEILQCYHFGANSFVTKPVKFDDYFEKMQNLERYWLTTNKSRTTIIQPSSCK